MLRHGEPWLASQEPAEKSWLVKFPKSNLGGHYHDDVLPTILRVARQLGLEGVVGVQLAHFSFSVVTGVPAFGRNMALCGLGARSIHFVALVTLSMLLLSVSRARSILGRPCQVARRVSVASTPPHRRPLALLPGPPCAGGCLR